MKDSKVEMIDPQAMGLRTITLQYPVFDEAALAAADAAMESMSESFPEWLENEVSKLQIARQAAEIADWSIASVTALYSAAHDTKGLGTTFGYPIVTELAASLCRLVETEAGKAVTMADPSLARAHVDAIRAALRDRITSSAHPVGKALVSALNARVEALGVAPV